MREAIRLLLAEHSDEVRVIAEAANFSDTVELAWRLKPQVIVMDLYMTKRIVSEDVRRALTDASGSRLLTMSISNDDEAVELARSYGSDALLDKMDLYNSLVPTIVRLAFPSSASV